MDEPTSLAGEVDPRMTERWHALIDMLYLTQVTGLYLLSGLYPFMGVLYGILLLVGGRTPKTKRIGRICLILGIINTALFIIATVVLVVLGVVGALAAAGD
jgi:hypothetical protein